MGTSGVDLSTKSSWSRAAVALVTVAVVSMAGLGRSSRGHPAARPLRSPDSVAKGTPTSLPASGPASADEADQLKDASLLDVNRPGSTLPAAILRWPRP